MRTFVSVDIYKKWSPDQERKTSSPTLQKKVNQVYVINLIHVFSLFWVISPITGSVFIFFLLICFVKCMRGSCRWCGGVRTPFRPMKNSYFLNLHSKATTKKYASDHGTIFIIRAWRVILIHRCAIVLDLKVHSL